MLPPCEVELELVEPTPLELLELLDPLDPLELLLVPPELELESSELVEVVVVRVVLLECCDDTTATEIPVAPTPRTAVAIAAADARCNQRRRLEAASEVTMGKASFEAPQPHSKRRSSDRQVLLKAP